jgi:RNA polymerase sigma-70 factor (ECF subfamily)
MSNGANVGDPSRASDSELIAAALQQPGTRHEPCIEALYRRYYPRVAHWCVKTCRDREEAADLAQEVFLRVHSRLRTFRGDSSFSTWLYTVMRSVAINRGLAQQRVVDRTVADSEHGESVEQGRDAVQLIEQAEEIRQLRGLIGDRLRPLEARVLYLHYVDGLSLPAITRLLELGNKSGAKAFIVSGKRKLRRGLADQGRRNQPLLRISS